MQLPEKAILRRYNALANDWTPLSRKPCWLSNAFHCKDNYMKRNRFAWFRLPILSTQIPSADNKLHCPCDKSFADDLVPSRYCKRESNLCITIRWGFCGVSSICSSLIFPSMFICRSVQVGRDQHRSDDRMLTQVSQDKLNGSGSGLRVLVHFQCKFRSGSDLGVIWGVQSGFDLGVRSVCDLRGEIAMWSEGPDPGLIWESDRCVIWGLRSRCDLRGEIAMWSEGSNPGLIWGQIGVWSEGWDRGVIWGVQSGSDLGVRSVCDLRGEIAMWSDGSNPGLICGSDRCVILGVRSRCDLRGPIRVWSVGSIWGFHLRVRSGCDLRGPIRVWSGGQIGVWS